jgi:predicted metal-dependent hydrolase
VRIALVGWFYERALEVLPGRVTHYSHRLNAHPKALKIREYKSRWGFCRADGLIALNWRLIQAPLAVIDYVVVHELIHQTYPHHQPTFWAAVKRARPTADHERQWLKTHGRELFW